MKHHNICTIGDRNPSFIRPVAALIAVFALAACSDTQPVEQGGVGGKVGAGGSSDSSHAATGGTSSKDSSAKATGGATDEDATGGQGKGGAKATTGVGGKSVVDTSAAVGGKVAAGGTSAKDSKSETGGKAATGGAAAGGKSGGTTSASGGAVGGEAGQSTTPASPGDFVENSGVSCKATAGATKTNKKLPDPFAMHDGTRIAKKADWECRRNEIKADIEKYEIGPKPEPPKVEPTYASGKLTVKVTTSAGSITLSSSVSGSGDCVVIGMNSASSLVSGCVQVPFSHDQVVKYAMNDTQTQSDPFYKAYPDLYGKIGNYNAWSWGISRLIDGIVQLKDQMKVDPTKIAVHGCSYAGKMALFAGALDERVALTIVQESGGGGINSWRTSQDFTSRTGTNIEKIDNTNYSWFMPSMKRLDPYSLPHDHHELIAMAAPRALIALGNPEMEWLGDESGYKSVIAAKEVFKAMGVEDNLGYDFTGGHDHCAAPNTQKTSVNAFVDKFLKGKTSTSTKIAIKPNSSKFDLTTTSVIDWTTPTLQ